MAKNQHEGPTTWRRLEEDAALAGGMTFRLVYSIASETRAPVYGHTLAELEGKCDELFAGCSPDMPFEYYLARTRLQRIEARIEEHTEEGWQPVSGTARRAVWHIAPVG